MENPMGLKWITHQGKQILYVDFSDCKTEQAMIQLAEEEAKEVLAQPGKVLAINNMTGTSIGTDFMNVVKKFGKEIGPAKIAKGAVLGITGLKGILFDGFLRATGDSTTKSFNTEQEALSWLVRP
jgi:hypothetical protein